jgi:hypothetical protein
MPAVSASIAALLSLLALIAGARPAQATSTLVTLHEVVFSDGGTASGTFSLNVLGFLDPQRDIATTAGSVLGATTYTSSGCENNSAPPADFVVFFSPGFKDGVQFQFLHPLGTVAMDHIVLGGVSCEFASFSCQSSPHRDVISGFAESEVVISLPQIPEPGYTVRGPHGAVGTGDGAAATSLVNRVHEHHPWLCRALQGSLWRIVGGRMGSGGRTPVNGSATGQVEEIPRCPFC